MFDQRQLITALFATTFLTIGDAAAVTIRWDCMYDKYFSPDNWTAKAPENFFTMSFTLNTNTEEAHMIGNADTVKVRFTHGQGAITFMEYLHSGAVQTTTIAIGSGMSVHSRNTYMVGDIVPSQYYGKCRESGKR